MNQVHSEAVSRVDAKNGGGAKDGCCRRDQKWMLEPEVDALYEQEVNDTTKRRRLPREGLVQRAIFSGRDAFRVKAAET